MKLKKIVLLLIPILIVFSVIAIVRKNHDKTYSSTIDVEVAPQDATVLIANHRISTGNNRVKPGTYTLLFKRTGFADQTKSISTTKNKSSYVGVILKPNSPDTANWFADHSADQAIAERIAARSYDSRSEQIQDEQPLIKLLPYIGAGFEFRIDYSTSTNNNTPTIIITADTDQAKQDALSWINSQGYDASKLKIQYTTSYGNDN